MKPKKTRSLSRDNLENKTIHSPDCSVAIVKCPNYNQKEIDKAIKKILQLLEIDLKKHKNILIKPNILGGYGENQEAITTHPSIVKAILKQARGKKIIGESSFSDTKLAFEKSGYHKFKNKFAFESEELVKINNPKGRILKEFYLPKIVKEADFFINVPKLKTHVLTKMTGAIKNLYGCIPGGMKQVFHKKARGDENFSSLLVDIYQNIHPELSIIDAVIGMEGDGPSAGKTRKVGLIMASRNAVALDIACAKLMGFNPEEVLVVKEAVERGLYPGFEIEIIGELKKIPNLKFIKPKIVGSLIKSALSNLVKENPIVLNKEKCTKCKICAKHCPVKAIPLSPYPEIDRKKCIRCFCCIEVCPQHALHLKETMARAIIRKMREAGERRREKKRRKSREGKKRRRK